MNNPDEIINFRLDLVYQLISGLKESGMLNNDVIAKIINNLN
jgi:hypothetical protein